MVSAGRSLGVDFGVARIGLAISDDLGLLAHPLQTLDARQPQVAGEVLRLAKEKNVATIVVGLPRHMNGSEGASASAARDFADQLQGAAAAAGLPELQVVLEDERLSTVAAARALREAGHRGGRHKGRVDQGAAQVILQTWLDRQALRANLSSF